MTTESKPQRDQEQQQKKMSDGSHRDGERPQRVHTNAGNFANDRERASIAGRKGGGSRSRGR